MGGPEQHGTCERLSLYDIVIQQFNGNLPLGINLAGTKRNLEQLRPSPSFTQRKYKTGPL